MSRPSAFSHVIAGSRHLLFNELSLSAVATSHENETRPYYAADADARHGELLQRFSSSHSQGFKHEDFGNSPGWWATTFATYCPSRPWQLTLKKITKHVERVDENRCTFSALAVEVGLLRLRLLISYYVFAMSSRRGQSIGSSFVKDHFLFGEDHWGSLKHALEF